MKVLRLVVTVALVTELAFAKITKPRSKNHYVNYHKMFKAAYTRYKGADAFQELLRTSTPRELRQRIHEFKKFVTLVDDINDGDHSFSASINDITVLTEEERIKEGIYLNNDFNASYWKEIYQRTPAKYTVVDAPEDARAELRSRRGVVNSINWVSRGAVIKPRNQKACWSCWAFSGAISIESNYYLKTGDLVEMSKQEILDCGVEYFAETEDRYYRNSDGCDGGHVQWGLTYVIDKDHLTTASALPYQIKDNPCNAAGKENALKKAKVVGIRASEGGQKGLQRLASDGIVSVSLQTTDRFHVYREGIYEGDKSCMVSPTHSVNVVGFTPEFWYIKNTWGPYWGEGGYMKMGRKSKFDCLVTNFALMPILECRDGAECKPPVFDGADDGPDSFGIPDYDETKNFYMGELLVCGTLQMGNELCFDMDNTAQKYAVISGVCDTIYCLSTEDYIISRGTGLCLDRDDSGRLQHKLCTTNTVKWEFNRDYLKLKDEKLWVEAEKLTEGSSLRLASKASKSSVIHVNKELCWEEKRKKKYSKILKTKPSSYDSFDDAEDACGDYGSKCQGIYYDSQNNVYKLASKPKISGSKVKTDVVYIVTMCDMTCDAGHQRCDNGRCMEKCDPDDTGCPMGTVRCQNSGKCYHEHMCSISEF